MIFVKRVVWVAKYVTSKANDCLHTIMCVLICILLCCCGHDLESRCLQKPKCLMRCHRKSFTSDSDYWSFAKNELFKKIDGHSFAFESDPSGTFLGGSHVFATARDWARFGQLYLQVSHLTKPMSNIPPAKHND